jgi:GNAT superfamily N-acetyltransferase
MKASHITFTVQSAATVTSSQLEGCANLFSAHYGVWGDGAPPSLRGQRVRLSANKLREQYLFNEDCCLATATLPDGTIVGHAFATVFHDEMVGGQFSWITQLVVDSQYRSQGVASKLCQLAWDVDAVAGCGIVTSHPHAIKALEKATRRHCKPGMIDHARSLLKASRIPYLQDCMVSCQSDGSGMCVVDSNFFVDHTEVDQLVTFQPARLGLRQLEAGHEFVAFTLRSWTP